MSDLIPRPGMGNLASGAEKSLWVKPQDDLQQALE